MSQQKAETKNKSYKKLLWKHNKTKACENDKPKEGRACNDVKPTKIVKDLKH